jgi:hypothetical protein
MVYSITVVGKLGKLSGLGTQIATFLHIIIITSFLFFIFN